MAKVNIATEYQRLAQQRQGPGGQLEKNEVPGKRLAFITYLSQILDHQNAREIKWVEMKKFFPPGGVQYLRKKTGFLIALSFEMEYKDI